MFRPSRPSLHWLLWLVIALLPLRGWAMAQMAQMVVVAPVASAQHVADAQPPCHGDTSASARAKATPGHAGCSLCEVCHASLGTPMVIALHLPALPHAVPTATPITGVRDGPPGELFRPPRHAA